MVIRSRSMKRGLLMLGALICAYGTLAVGHAVTADAATLVDQSSPEIEPGVRVGFNSNAPSYDMEGADDFVVPAGARWNVNSAMAERMGWQLPAAERRRHDLQRLRRQARGCLRGPPGTGLHDRRGRVHLGGLLGRQPSIRSVLDLASAQYERTLCLVVVVRPDSERQPGYTETPMAGGAGVRPGTTSLSATPQPPDAITPSG